MRTLFLFVEIIGTSIKNIAAFGAHLNDHVAVCTLWTFEDIMLVNFVIRHEITYFNLICTDPKIQPVVFIED